LISYFEVGLEGTDIHTKMLHWVAMQFLDEPTFNQLRTIEQLGYVVVARKTDYRDVMGAQFLIQSPKESSEYIVNSLNNFLNSIKEKVATLTEEEFKVQVEAVLTKVAEKDYNLN
jgi:insulysin